MSKRMVFKTVGLICLANAGLLLLPLIVAFIYRDTVSVKVFLKSIVVALSLGLILVFPTCPAIRVDEKAKLTILSLSWIISLLIGSLPFYFSRQVQSYVDALFESVSGFTTTGASIFRNITLLPEAMLFWRSLTQWIGGMGVLIFFIMLAHTKKPQSVDTAKLLLKIYIVLTALEVVFLLAGGMNLFESLVHAFGTAGTGGFCIKLDSVGSYSPYIQWVITIFMLLFGINFNLYYLILLRKFREVFKSTELWCYIGIVAVSVSVITINIYPLFVNVADAIRVSSFQVSSIITTTGWSTVDFDAWPTLSKGILFILMLTGGCAGSTAGGLKLSRIGAFCKLIWRKLKGMPCSELSAVGRYFVIYAICFLLVFLLLCFEPFDFETNITAAVACFNNVGTGFARVGPMINFSRYSDFAKIVLSVAMLFGRLELFPLILIKRRKKQ